MSLQACCKGLNVWPTQVDGVLDADADAELAVGLLGQVADRIDGRPRPDPRHARPRRRRAPGTAR